MDPTSQGSVSEMQETNDTPLPVAPRARRSKWWGVAALVLGGLVLGGCQLPTFGARAPVTTQGHDAIKLWQGFFITGAVVFLFVLGLIMWAVFRYRRRSDAIPRQTQYHVPLEIFYTAVPVVTVLVLFGFTFVTENNVDALPKQNLTVTVTAFQWGWRFHYTTKDVTVIGVELQDPQMVLPEHENVRIRLQSHDVIHGFYVPAFDFSRYAQPGIINQFTITPKALGVYRGQCTQFCGLYHSLMRFSVKVVTPAGFTAWVSTHHSSSSSSISTAQHQEPGGSTVHPSASKTKTATSATYTGSTGL